MKNIKFFYFFICMTLCMICLFPSYSHAAQAKNEPAKVTVAPTIAPIPSPTPAPEKTKTKSKSKIRLNVAKLNMTKNSRYVLRVYNMKKKYKVVFSSSSSAIVSFLSRSSKNRRARLSADNVGTAFVTVTVKHKKRVISRLKCTIHVCPQAFSIKYPKQEITLVPGKTHYMKPIVKPNISNEIPVYTSSNPEVASINSKGKVTAHMLGVTEITAKLLNGQTATYTVYVTDIILSTPKPDLYANEEVLAPA